MEIDEDTAGLIVEIYKKIHSLKSLLHELSNSEWGDFTESGNKLSWMMDKIIEDKPTSALKEDMSEARQYIGILIKRSSEMPGLSIQNQLKIEAGLNDISTGLKSFQEKIAKSGR